MTDIHAQAEQHWQFIEKLLKTYTEEANKTSVSMETTHVLYVAAMVHGYKHGKEEKSCIKERI